MNLRSWLRRSPKPAQLRCDGQLVPVPSAGNVWAQLEETVTALGASRIEALDASGAILRATQLESDDDAPAAAPASHHGDGQLDRLARIIAEAHDAGARRHAQAYETAFARQLELLGVVAARLTSLETAYHRSVTQVAQLQLDAAQAAGGDDATNAITGMLAAAMGAAPAAPAPTPIRKAAT